MRKLLGECKCIQVLLPQLFVLQLLLILHSQTDYLCALDPRNRDVFERVPLLNFLNDRIKVTYVRLSILK